MSDSSGPESRFEVDAQLRKGAERWLRKQGLPHLIEDYSARSNIFTRMLPMLVVVFFGELMLAFGDRFSGWAQTGIFIVFLLVFLVGWAAVNRLRKRRLFQLPDTIGALELAVVILLPALLSMLTATGNVWEAFLSVAGLNVALLGVGYFVTSYGLVSMLGWSLKFMVKQLVQVMRLVARSLPLLLLFAAFLFLNNEMWQVAADFTGPFYAIILGLFVLVSCTFLVVNVGEETKTLGDFSSWQEVAGQVEQAGSPLTSSLISSQLAGEELRPMPLAKRARFNVGLLLFISQFVRYVLASATMGIFFVIFGLLAVRRSTIEAWIQSDVDAIATWSIFGAEMLLTWELLAVVGFISALSGLQFVVSSLTDSTYKQKFFDDIKQELNEVLAVRRVYLEL